MTAHTPQCTSALLMVPPKSFAFNEQTGMDNEFQQRPEGESNSDLRNNALQEFDAMVTRLQQAGAQVVQFSPEGELPDAVFPNNWFATTAGGELHLFPMKTPNRQAEVQPQALTRTLANAGFAISRIIDWRETAGRDSGVLEGTGSLIFDHCHHRIFAARSERCTEQLAIQFAHQQQHELILFDAYSSQGRPFYHTNIMLSIGQSLAAVCLEAIGDAEQRLEVEKALRQHHQLLELSLCQTQTDFCGNLLEIRSQQGEPLFVLSQRAWMGLTSQQQKLLERHGQPVVCELDTIERIGGGSARCMMAEIFLPQATC